MEAQMHRPQDTGLHSGERQGQVHDEGEHHPKQSVLKKVKAKAKKIKDHIKHGLGHEHDQEHDKERHSLQGDEEEENDDEDMEEGAEVHGGPYAIRSKDIPKEDVVPMGNLENPTSTKEDRYDSKMKNEEVHKPILQRQDEFARPPSLGGTHFPEERQTPSSAETHETKGMDDHVNTLRKHEHQGLQGHENIIGASTGLVGHHASHRPITAAGETHDPKGFDHAPEVQGYQGQQGHENVMGAPTGMANPDASNFHEQMHRPVAATHETEGFDHVTDHGKLKDQGLQGRKIGVPTGMEEDTDAPRDHPEMNPNPSNYQSKVTDPTGANNEEAGVSPLVQSFEKMGVNDDPETTGIRTEQRAGDIKLDQGTEHSQYTGSHDQFAPEEAPVDFTSVPEEAESIPKSMNPSKPEDLPQDTLTGKPHDQFAPEEAPVDFTSVPEETESIPESMNPSKPEDLPQDTLTGKPGSYTEKISSATSAIAGKAVAAKNAVASKLGYGGTEEQTRDREATAADNDATKTTSATALAQKAARTVAGKLAPVYEKVAGAGSTVMAKVQGTATGVTGHENRGGADAEHEVKTDKGVSMKDYLAEKFKPGEEDKALSEVISGSLLRQKDKTEETGEAKPMGKVTESVEVERRLGPIGETKKEGGDVASGETKVGEGFGQGVVDRVKGAVNTWLGKGGEAQANDSAGSGGAVVGGRR